MQTKIRIFYLLILLSGLIVLLGLRLAWLQFADPVPARVAMQNTDISERAVRQREERIELDSGRGQFVDRHGRSLTGQLIWTPVLFPVGSFEPLGINSSKAPAYLHQAATLLNTSPEELGTVWGKLTHPATWTGGKDKLPIRLSLGEAKAINKQNVPGLAALPYVLRYPEAAGGRQWLGFLAEQPERIRELNLSQPNQKNLPISSKIGASGLERTLDRMLQGLGPTQAAYRVDAHQKPIGGEAVRIHTPRNPYYPVKVKTTIDLGIQAEIEKLTAAAGVAEGAVVVLDTKTADVLAMVSSPFFQPNHIELSDQAWSNRAVKAAVPGSIFKTVTAAAALEAGLTSPSEAFHCNGDYGKYGLSCWKEHGHGRLSLGEGYAKSCNTVFASLGERLSPFQLERTADQLGLGRLIGWSDSVFYGKGQEPLRMFDQEEAGTVFGKEKDPSDKGVLAQTAIGQRSVLMTPLQAANLVVTLINGGVVHAPRLVSDVYYADGTPLAALKPHAVLASSGRISPQTAATLLGWMRKVVTEGTGRSLADFSWDLAGKSGTAQVTRHGRKLNDQWFIGYGPIQHPRYAVAVLVQGKKPGTKSLATELFGEVMNILYKRTQTG
ncbi:peptidoglycan D,D-transpeptidase FtsI family protein [Paenibacillus sp. CAA11]|uniref:peptidoglycan D,D-transpeptidase FtsI family protein n=1 Tax=Paenibacillus sp. CAA11 TaxID=1532905 RepID=UPI001F40ED75|nr:penicillin-binding transpeptidase domain-containing protein [Paenibacillus sp. CAA11]